jgi:hypothetical protein
MPAYRVLFSQIVSITIDVEADDPEAAIEAAYEEGPGGLCFQCSGYRQSWSRDDDGELEAEAVYEQDGRDEVWGSPESWRRVKS